MSETQLERSVLEAKDRDELVAIADALGARPPRPRQESRPDHPDPAATGIDESLVGRTGPPDGTDPAGRVGGGHSPDR